MPVMILLDTHVLIWLDGGSDRLKDTAIAMIDEALVKEELFVSSITFWEVAMLVNKQRLEIAIPLSLWRKNLLDSGLRELPVNGIIGIQAAELQIFHGDPADRIITASAIETSAYLLTSDRKILAWDGLINKLDPAG